VASPAGSGRDVCEPPAVFNTPNAPPASASKRAMADAIHSLPTMGAAHRRQPERPFVLFASAATVAQGDGSEPTDPGALLVLPCHQISATATGRPPGPVLALGPLRLWQRATLPASFTQQKPAGRSHLASAVDRLLEGFLLRRLSGFGMSVGLRCVPAPSIHSCAPVAAPRRPRVVAGAALPHQARHSSHLNPLQPRHKPPRE
jgi:hypothetical protein